MQKITLFFFLALFYAGSASARPTELGSGGNAYAAQRFAKYQSEGFICAPPEKDAIRVVLSGFAPFNGGTQNLSGDILRAFGGFSPPNRDVDAYGSTRRMKIGEADYQICFIVASTTWDISAAILISEIERFAPEFALMTGLGYLRFAFEAGNSNRARFAGGFDINGQPAADNMPQENYVLPPTDPSVEFISLLTWDPKTALEAAKGEIAGAGLEGVVPEAGYATNNFICNNVAFTATHALKGMKTELAGGQIILNPRFEKAPKLGFMHYPMATPTDPESLPKWAAMLAKIIRSQTQPQ